MEHQSNVGAPVRPLTVDFTASGSEYFRIWIVNLLLIVVTLGFYLPFAKARRLRYFYANTVVDGEALAFHGDAWKMFRGYLLMWLLTIIYSALNQWSPRAALVGFLGFALLWPALWRSSLMFRLGNTSWRGLRFGFEGSLGDAYKAMLPWFAPTAVLLIVGLMAGKVPSKGMLLTAGVLGLLLPLLMFPLGLGLSKIYQHNGYRYAAQSSRMKLGLGSFYGLGLKIILLGIGLVVLAGIGAAVLIPLMALMPNGARFLLSLALMLGFYALLAMPMSYFVSRLQNLCWNATRAQDLRFRSKLSARELCKLNVLNSILIVLTLGLYRPFAVVRVMELKLAALTVHMRGNLDDWHAQALQLQGSGAGEMSGDFFGIDMGL